LEKTIAEFSKASGVELVAEDEDRIRAEPLPALLHLTGGTEHLALKFAESTRSPLLLLAHRGENSLPAGLETWARLRQEGRKSWLVTLETAGELGLFALAAGIARELRGKKLALLGGASPWLVASVPASAALREKLGLEVLDLPLAALKKFLPEGPGEAPAGFQHDVDEASLGRAGQIYGALRGLVQELGVSAFSLACFELLREGCTSCWAIARLSAEGIPSGCEGDLPSLLALWIGWILTGKPGFMANPADVDLKEGRLLLAHCTVPLSLAENFVLRRHFESGIGVAVEGRLAPGPYTLVRFGGRALEKLFVVEGTVLSEGPGREDLCRTQAWFHMSKGALQKLLREPLGNHHVLLSGHHRRVLTRFHEVFLAD
jgi:L-fucose isomerase-like protein